MRDCSVLRKENQSYLTCISQVVISLGFFFSSSETSAVPLTCVLLDQLIPHLLEGKYSHLCCSHNDVSILRGDGWDFY